MLTLLGNRRRKRDFCDGISRRNFLNIGGLALGGFSLPQLLRAEAAAGVRAPHKGVIMVFLAGGPPHQEMWEIKTEAPSEIRGEFNPISTRVPGLQICELFPQIAARMDRVSVIRSLVGCLNEHSPYMCYSGYSERDFRARNRPCLGSFLSKVQGPVDQSVPPFVSLALKTLHAPWANPGEPGFLGRSYAPFQPDGAGAANMKLNGITLDRLGDRRGLLASVDRFRRDIDRLGELSSVDEFTAQALGVLTSSKLVRALDLEQEEPGIRDKYGRGKPIFKSSTHPANWHTEQFLVARRLIQAGVRCVTLNFGTWDSHNKNSERMRHNSPHVDLGVSALVDDLHEQGMLDDVAVVVWGEFGRTPKINKTGGRDHWPQVSCALLAGGGMRPGQAIGSTNRLGEVPQERPVHYQDVFATLYRQLGIDVSRVTVPDPQGRPQYLLDRHEIISELV